MTVAPALGYDRSDWASAFRNVGVELDGVALTAARGAIPWATATGRSSAST